MSVAYNLPLGLVQNVTYFITDFRCQVRGLSVLRATLRGVPHQGAAHQRAACCHTGEPDGLRKATDFVA